MFASRILRNVGATGNRLMNNGPGPSDNTMLWGAGALAGLTGFVYWAGYKAEGSSKAGRARAKEIESRASQYTVPK
ncbi:hypothetical protein JR316_0008805 [Psilocybe cubensis]|uniref:Uncharacterized protein n=2 Tax=Psilocybe cubensis TaxID=181762 RepID=A0ACB8GS05_PSICU|nr:hypothetical protein JR316_0008805 [Psilocybe cubensis]KAH9478351.1 hypothetical protein JR316_0008805 [Psilocybe cubensis]